MSVTRIVEDVRNRGDAALHEWSLRLDGVEPAPAEPTEVPADAVLALADAVRRWHALQRPADVRLEVAPGVELERRWVPLASVGIYVPCGLVSTLIMCAVPAQVAAHAEESRRGNLPVPPFAPSPAHAPRGVA